MIRIPRFKSHVRVGVTPPDLVFFVQESGYRVIQGRILYLLAPLIDGKRTTHQIASRLKTEATVTDVKCGLLLLEAEGYLLDAKHALPTGLELYRDSLNVEPEQFANALHRNSARVVSYSQISGTKFTSILAQLGITVSKKGSFTVVLVDDYLQDELKRFNRIAVEKKLPWIILKPIGNVLWIGPFFSPPDTACWNCLAERLKEKRRVDAFIKAHQLSANGYYGQAPSAIGPATDMAMNLTALQTLKWITADKIEQEQTYLLTLDIKEMKLEKHTVMRRADCSTCGIVIGPPAPLKTKRSAEQSDGLTTFQKYEHHISVRTGIIDEMKSQHAGTNGVIYSVVADHIFIPNLKKGNLLKKGLTQKSWGKGLTEEQAKTGALCEALERYSGVLSRNRVSH